MACPNQPVVNVKTSDTTGYIIEFTSQTAVGPAGCVRVTTRDVWKLSAISQTMTAIVPNIPKKQPAFSTQPDVVIISPRMQPCFNKKPVYQSQPYKVYQPEPSVRTPSDVRTNCVSMEDVACLTDSVCRKCSSSQTEVVKCQEKSCGNDGIDDLEYYEEEKEQCVQNLDKSSKKCTSSKSDKSVSRDRIVEKKDSNCKQSSSVEKQGRKCSCKTSDKSANAKSRSERKKCTCPKPSTSTSSEKKRSTSTEQKKTCTPKKTTNDKSTGMDTDSSTSGRSCENQQKEKEYICKSCRSKSKDGNSDTSNSEKSCENQQKEKEYICKSCKSKSKDENNNDTGTSSQTTNPCKEVQDKDKQEPDNKNTKCCLSNNEVNLEVQENKDQEMKLMDIYRNDEFTKSNVKQEEADCHQKYHLTKSTSMMNVDDCPSKTSNSWIDEESEKNLSSSNSLCNQCKIKQFEPANDCRTPKDNVRKESPNADFDNEDISDISKNCDSESNVKKLTLKTCRACKMDESSKTDSHMSMSDCGTVTSDPCFGYSDEIQANVMHLNDECMQCIPIDVSTVSSESDRPSSCMSAEEPLSITQSIKNFVSRYVWGDPVSRDDATQCSDTSCNEQNQCYVWYIGKYQQGMLQRHVQSNLQRTRKPRCKDSSTQMEVDDFAAYQYSKSENKNLKHILKKHSDKMDYDSNTSSESFSKRNVNFKSEAEVVHYEKQPKTKPVVDRRQIDERESNDSNVVDIFMESSPDDDDEQDIRKGDTSLTSLHDQEEMDNNSRKRDLSLTSIDTCSDNRSFGSFEDEHIECDPEAKQGSNSSDSEDTTNTENNKTSNPPSTNSKNVNKTNKTFKSSNALKPKSQNSASKITTDPKCKKDDKPKKPLIKK